MYMLKTPLFMGTPDKVLTEANQVELNDDDQVNQTLKNFLIVRALTLENNFDALKQLLQQLMAGDTPQKANVQPLSMVIQYFAQNVSANSKLKLLVQKIDEGLIKKSCELIETDVGQLESNLIIHTLVAYYLYAQQDLNRLFQMLAKTKSHEMLALKLIAFTKINRVDMAEQTLK